MFTIFDIFMFLIFYGSIVIFIGFGLNAIMAWDFAKFKKPIKVSTVGLLIVACYSTFIYFNFIEDTTKSTYELTFFDVEKSSLSGSTKFECIETVYLTKNYDDYVFFKAIIKEFFHTPQLLEQSIALLDKCEDL